MAEENEDEKQFFKDLIWRFHFEDPSIGNPEQAST
jgi:hypothetical protein